MIHKNVYKYIKYEKVLTMKENYFSGNLFNYCGALKNPIIHIFTRSKSETCILIYYIKINQLKKLNCFFALSRKKKRKERSLSIFDNNNNQSSISTCNRNIERDELSI